MKKFILFLVIALVFTALGWFGGRKFFPPKEAADSSVSGESVSGAEGGVSGNAEAAADDALDGGVSGNAEAAADDALGGGVSGSEGEADGIAAGAEETDAAQQTEELDAVEKLKAEEGVLYALKTSTSRTLGTVPVVGGDAVILMDGGSATTRQGEYAAEAGQGVLQGKLEEETALAASEGKVGAWAFYREAAMKEFAIPEGVSAVEKFAFARSGIGSIMIPEGVTSIGAGAFYHCDSLADVTIPDSVTEVGANAFAHTPWLDSWMAGGAASPGESENAETPDTGDFLIVGDGVLIAYRGNETDPVLPPAVKSIAPGVLGE